MLLDANILLYSIDELSPYHEVASTWLSDRLNGSQRVGFPWPTLTAFLRISTHPRAAANPLSPEQAWDHVVSWLATEVAWVPQPTAQHAEVFGEMLAAYLLRGNLIPDGHLAALAVEHGLTVCSTDTDFARFTEITWINPLADWASEG
jgi:toxin-antitoxin system PIN domain toxin